MVFYVESIVFFIVDGMFFGIWGCSVLFRELCVPG